MIRKTKRLTLYGRQCLWAVAFAICAALALQGSGVQVHRPSVDGHGAGNAEAVWVGNASQFSAHILTGPTEPQTVERDVCGVPLLPQAVADALRNPLNVFSSDDDRVVDILAVKGGLDALIDFLATVPDATGSSPTYDRDRLRAIDLTQAIASSSHSSEAERDLCIDTLARLAELPIDKRQAVSRRRTALGDKFDAFAALVRVAPVRGIQAYAATSSAHRRFLNRAVLLALVDLGMARNEAQQYLDTIVADQ